MIPSVSKEFVFWILDSISSKRNTILCRDVIVYEILPYLKNYNAVLNGFRLDWEQHIQDTFIWGCTHDHSDIVKWLWETYLSDQEEWLKKYRGNTILKYDNKDPDNFIFEMVCENGCLNTAKWLLKTFDWMRRHHCQNRKIFGYTCRSGSLDMIQWIWKISTIKEDIIECINYTFSGSCTNDHLDVAKWLLKIALENHRYINLYSPITSPFESSLRTYGNNVPKWLWNLSVKNGRKYNLHAKNDYPFRMACIGYDLTTVKWLWELAILEGSKYYIDDEMINNARRCPEIRNWLIETSSTQS